MLLPLYVLVCLFSSLQRFCEITRVQSRDSGWKSVGVWCAVFVSSHRTTHYRSKMVKSMIFFPHVCGLSHFEDLLKLYKSFSVYPALGVGSFDWTNSLATCLQPLRTL